MSFTSDNMTKSAFSMFDMMLTMQRMSLQAAAAYQPFVSALFNSAKAMERSGFPVGTALARQPAPREFYDANEEKVIGLGEEILNVGTRMVPGKTTRVRRIVVQSPVHQDVTLHTETVVLERRKPLESFGDGLLTEVTVEMSDFNEVPIVSKTVNLVEEVLLRKEVTARVETIHETVRRDTLEIEQPSRNLPVVFQAAAKQEDAKRQENPVEESPQPKKSFAPPPQTAHKVGDHKRT
jgi:stress response protein YsnF